MAKGSTSLGGLGGRCWICGIGYRRGDRCCQAIEGLKVILRSSGQASSNICESLVSTYGKLC